MTTIYEVVIWLVIFMAFLLPEGQSSTYSKHLPHDISFNQSDLIREIITPFFGYFVCEYYIGTEVGEFADIAAPIALKLNCTDDLEKVQAHDMIYVQVNYLEVFIDKYISVLKVPIFLVTGQWREPYVTMDPTVDRRYLALKNSQQITTAIINNSYILHWFMQNPHIFHDKISGIPYGINHRNLESYANILRHFDSFNKTQFLTLTYFSSSHWTRTPLIAASKKNNKQVRLNGSVFYTKIAESYYVLSPVGDRPDCYRHWEAIGLGAIPICNCPITYGPLFRGNMLFVSNSDYNHIIELSDTWAKSTYQVPSRRLVFVSYWRAVLHETRQSKINAYNTSSIL